MFLYINVVINITTYKQIYKYKCTNIKQEKTRDMIIMTDSYIHFKIDSDLKKKLQIKALQENTTITAVLTEYIKSYIEENK